MSAIDGSSAPAHSYSLRSSAPAHCSSSIEGDGNGYCLLADPAASNRACSETGGAEVRAKGLPGRMRRKRFVGVRQRPSGRWVAEIKDTTQKIRMWLGTFETAEAAARAYDEAACLLRGSNTRTNFVTSVSKNSPLACRIRRLLSLRHDSNKGGPQHTGALFPEERCVSTTTEELDPPAAHKNSAVGPAGSPAPSAQESSEGVHSYSALDGLSAASIDEDLPNFVDEPSGNVKFGESGPCFDVDQYFSWPFDFGPDINTQWPAFYDELVALPWGPSSAESELCSEQALGFKRMKFERRISASLYAINGVQECLQNLSQPFADPHECITAAAAAAVLSPSYNSGVWDRTANSSSSQGGYNSGGWDRTANSSSSQGGEIEEHLSQADALWDLPPLCPLSCKS